MRFERWFVSVLLLVPGAGCLPDGVGPVPDGGVARDSGRDGPGGGSDDGASGEVDASDGADVPVLKGTWVNVTANLSGLASECGNMSNVTAKPDEDMLIAGIAQQGLWASTDGGGTWSRLGQTDASSVITNRTTRIVFDPGHSRRFYESGIYNAGGVYMTQDDGVSLNELGSIHHVDLVSIDFSDPDRKTLLAGGHEQEKSLSRSSDQGATWTAVGGSLPAKTNCTSPLVIDSQTHLVGCGGFGGGPTGVYRSTDGGQTWASMSTVGGSGAPLVASDGSIYWASANDSGMARSVDMGVTWVEVTGANEVLAASPVQLPDGRIATLGPNAIVVSADHGASWTTVTTPVPYRASGLTYSAFRKQFYIWYFTCSGASPVPADAIMGYDFDYTTQ